MRGSPAPDTSCGRATSVSRDGWGPEARRDANTNVSFSELHGRDILLSPRFRRGKLGENDEDDDVDGGKKVSDAVLLISLYG